MKKGFTLIELLAVIVILAIIALIAIPQITNVVENVKKEAGARSVEGHVGGINNQFARKMLMGRDYTDGTYDLASLDVNTKGNVSCTSYTLKDNMVIEAFNCSINGYLYNYDMTNGAYLIDARSGNLDGIVYNRVNKIRNTSNTDISNRKGKIYYVANDGNDANDGLSEASPRKTALSIKNLSNGDTILFKDGDIFRDEQLVIKADDVLIGSYGDIKKGKPTLTRSLYDGAKQGKWIEVKKNIWKYQVDNQDPFNRDVGEIWLFCGKKNKSCKYSMTTLDKTFTFTKKIVTKKDYDETNLDSKIDTLLKNDLEFYHAGHANASAYSADKKPLYLYSTSNPAERFDEIEFANTGGILFTQEVTTGSVDNIKLQFVGNHGINTYTISNLKITNCEFGFIGGSVQSYNNNGDAVRYGNAIEVYGSVMDEGATKVSDGFVVKNNYIYQCYDAGMTFQLSTSNIARMEKARFIDNVVEYCAYDIEFWEYSSSTDPSIAEQSSIDDFLIANNILRYSGHGPSITREDRDAGASIKTWFNEKGTYNYAKNITIRDNIFSDAYAHFITYRTNKDTYPTIINNTFYGREDQNFSVIDDQRNAPSLIFDNYLLNKYLPGNNFVTIDKKAKQYKNASGKSGDVNWSYDASSYKLSITGSGDMKDYSESDLPPWSKYKDRIYSIEIGKDVTKLGKYAFYDLQRVDSIRIDSKNLKDLAGGYVGSVYHSKYYTFFQVGNKTTGTKLVFGPEVTRIPSALLTSGNSNSDTDNPNITEIVFEGNKVETVASMSLRTTKIRSLKIPNGVTSLGSNVDEGNKKLALIILPDSLETIGSTILSQAIEKIVFGPSIDLISGFMAYNTQAPVITVVAPHIVDPSKYQSVFKNIKSSARVDVYGDSSTEEWVNNIKTVNSKNINYHSLSEYKSTITSNTGINAIVDYNGEYTFTSSGNVTIKMYYDASDGRRCYVDADYTKNGNTYTIKHIKSDVYIEIK